MAKATNWIIVGSAIVKLIEQYGRETLLPVWDHALHMEQTAARAMS